MMVKINTHPIVVGAHEEYHIDWCGKIVDTHPKIENGMPIFFIKGSEGSTEINTIDIKVVERVAQKLTNPCGRDSITVDKAYIYIIEEDGNKTLLGIVTHNHIREYRQMYDEFEYHG